MIKVCKHCKKEFNISQAPKGWMANHIRWCDRNPKVEGYRSKAASVAVTAMNESKKKTGITNQFSKAKKLGLEIPTGPNKGKPGTFTGKKHSDCTKKLISEKALRSNHRRLKKNVIEYNGVLLDSSWELELAKQLDANNVKWIRPEPIKWIDEKNIEHNYFPDFFLPEHNLFLDPKNPYAVKVQKNKIKKLLTLIPNLVILTTLEQCQTYNPNHNYGEV